MKAYKHLVEYAMIDNHTVSVFDGEEWSLRRSDNAADIIREIESVEEAEIEIRAYDGHVIAWARVSAYGLSDDETVIDRSCHRFMDAWELAYDNDFPDKPLTIEQIHEAAAELRTGCHGSFAAAIGEAASYADSANLSRLAGAFPDIFAKAAATV